MTLEEIKQSLVQPHIDWPSEWAAWEIVDEHPCSEPGCPSIHLSSKSPLTYEGEPLILAGASESFSEPHRYMWRQSKTINDSNLHKNGCATCTDFAIREHGLTTNKAGRIVSE